MKKVIFVLCFMAINISLLASEHLKIPSKFDVAVSFGSMAGGPSSDLFLKNFSKKFAKKYSVSIIGYKASGCGREGEFNILYSLTTLKSAVKKKFLAEIKTAVVAEEKKNKAKDENSGNITVEYNKTKDDFSFCRDGIKIWK